MTEGTKQAYLDKMSAQLQEWGARMDVIKAKMAKESATARIDLNGQIETWKDKELLFKQKMEDVRASGADGLEKVKLAAQTVWDELTIYMKSNGEKNNEV